MNMLGTGGYGGTSYDKFADIVWTKNKHDIKFTINTKKIDFKLKVYKIDFKQNINNVQFKIENKNINFSIDTKSLDFKIVKCEAVSNIIPLYYPSLDFSKIDNSQYIGVI